MDKLEAIRLRASTGAALIGIGIILFFPSMAIFQIEWGCWLGVILGVIGGFMIRGTHEAYQKIYKVLFVEEPLEKNFDDLFYAWKSGFEVDEVNSFAICPKGNKVKSEDYIKASYNGIRFEMSDVKLIDTNRDRRNGNDILFSGRMLAFDFPGKTVKNTVIYTKSVYHRNKENAAKYKNVKMESSRFNEAFDVYADDAHDAFYLITPQFMECLQTLNRKYPNFGIRFYGNRVVVALNEGVNNPFDKVDWMVKTTYPQEMAKVQNDIDDVKRIIKAICPPEINTDNKFTTTF
jgi:hypothetical protein